MNKNNLKRYLLDAGKVNFEIDEKDCLIHAAYKNFIGTAATDSTDFATVGGRTRCMSRSFDTLIDCIIDTYEIIQNLEQSLEIQSDIDAQEIIFH